MDQQMLSRIVERIVRIIRLDAKVFPEIAHDEKATTEATLIVVVAALFNAIGAGIGGHSFGRFIITLLSSILISWLLWSWITMYLGKSLYGTQATFWELARALGYASAPMILGILGAITCIGWLITLAAAILSLIAGFLAVRETLELSTEKAIVTILIGWVVMVVVSVVLGIVIRV
jgi:hypothetical protein